MIDINTMMAETIAPESEVPTALTPGHIKALINDVLADLYSLRDNDVDLSTLPTREAMTAFAERCATDTADIAFVAAAVKIKFAQLRADLIAAEGERRGGDQKSDVVKALQNQSLTQETLISRAARNERYQIKPLAGHGPLVDEYLEHAKVTRKEGGPLPTLASTVRHIERNTGRPSKPPRTQRTILPARSRQATQFHVGQLKAQKRTEDILAALTVVADGTHYTDAALRRAIRHHAKVEVAEFLKTIRAIPWLLITRDDTGTTFTIDDDLRAICEGLAPRTTLPDGLSIAAFLHRLRGEITRRRKENHEGYRKRKWHTEASLKLEMHDLLNWIEDELQKVDDVLGS